MTSQRSHPGRSSSARASSVPEPGSSLAGPPRALAAPERWKVLVPGEEAAMRTPGRWLQGQQGGGVQGV